MPIPDPTVVRRQLGRHLRRFRDAARKTDADIDESGLMSRTKLWRIETGRVAAKPNDVRGLCWLYGVDAISADALAALALGTKAHGYWEDYTDVTASRFNLYQDLESVASEVRVYDPESIHPLLQTPAYACAQRRAANPGAAEKDMRGRTKLLLERQEAFHSRKPRPRLVAVLSDGALARLVDNRNTMAGQLARLRELNRLEQVDIRVLPWSAGAHPAMHVGPFTIMDFDCDDDPAVVCAGTLTGARYLEKPCELSIYRSAFSWTYRESHSVGKQHSAEL